MATLKLLLLPLNLIFSSFLTFETKSWSAQTCFTRSKHANNSLQNIDVISNPSNPSKPSRYQTFFFATSIPLERFSLQFLNFFLNFSKLSLAKAPILIWRFISQTHQQPPEANSISWEFITRGAYWLLYYVS